MSDREKLISHYKKIQEKHDLLDKQITEAYNHYTNDETVHKMKQEKLLLKEQMFNITQELNKKDAERIPGRF
jgi:uncharacterized protein YdcH (DUF465 family)